MAQLKPKLDGTKVITGLVRFSYPHVFTPDSINGGEEKYSVSLIIPKSDKDTINAIKTAIKTATEEGKTSKWGGKVPAKLDTPLRDGDIEREGDDAYSNAYFINPKSTKRPTVVDRKVNEIVDQDDFYPGCYGRASISFFPYEAAGNRGVGVLLNHVQKIEEGERLDGIASADEDFDILEDDDDGLLD